MSHSSTAHGATVNSVWYTPHPFAVSVPSYEAEVPTEMLDDVDDCVVTHLEVLDALVYVTLDGSECSPSKHDFMLSAMTPGSTRYQFRTSPDLMLVMSPGGAARYKVAFEGGLISRYIMYRPVHKSFETAPVTSSQIPLGLVSNSPDVFCTVIQCAGAGELFVTLDGRVASSTSYDYILTPGSGLPSEAHVFSVAPEKIRVKGEGGITWKLAFEQFQVVEGGSWADNPVYQTRGFR